MNFKLYILAALCAFALVVGSSGPSLAQSVNWNLSGNLSDGGTLIGAFIQDVYDFEQAGSLNFSTTSATFGLVTFNNSNIVSLNTSSTSISVENSAGYYLTLNFAHDLLSSSSNKFTGTESFRSTNLAVAGIAVPSPVAGAGLLALFAMAPFLFLTRRPRGSPEFIDGRPSRH
jgi:hypothetical protein